MYLRAMPPSNVMNSGRCLLQSLSQHISGSTRGLDSAEYDFGRIIVGRGQVRLGSKTEVAALRRDVCFAPR